MSAPTRWTPGPWRVNVLTGDGKNIKAGDDWTIKGANGDAVAFEGRALPNANANAALIAAAPELYEALRLLMHEVDESGLGEARDFGWPRASAAARAALAKARGEA